MQCFLALLIALSFGILNAQEEFEQYEYNQLASRLERTKLARQEFLKKKLGNGAPLKIVILGSSSHEYSAEGFNREVLVRMLRAAKTQNPTAIFFAGNLIDAIEQHEDPYTGNESRIDLLHIQGRFMTGVLPVRDYRTRLAAFARIIEDEVGSIPFYPIPGPQDTFDEVVSALLKERFDLDDAALLSDGRLAYGVELGNTFFAVAPTALFYKNRVMQDLGPSLLNWTEKTLKENAAKSTYRFFVGDAPIFPTGVSETVVANFTAPEGAAREFWKVLQQNKVSAYFCSDEALYDRSLRGSVWQIITGGAGSIRFFDLTEPVFYHYILLTIPQKGMGPPYMQVIDINGLERDSLYLTDREPAISHIRILAQ